MYSFDEIMNAIQQADFGLSMFDSCESTTIENLRNEIVRVLRKNRKENAVVSNDGK